MPTILPNSTGSSAFLVNAGDRTAPDALGTFITETEYSGTELNTVSVDDANGVQASGFYNAHLVKYQTEGDVQSGDFQVQVLAAGFGPEAQTLFVWKHSTTEWIQTDVDANTGSENLLTGSLGSEISDYLDGDGILWILVTGQGGAMQYVQLNYSELAYTAADAGGGSATNKMLRLVDLGLL